MAASSINLYVKQMYWLKVVSKLILFKPVLLLFGHKNCMIFYVFCVNKGIRFKIGNGKWRHFDGKLEIDWSSEDRGRG